MKLTQSQKNFFDVEIDNERHGGVVPATLDSAWDSLTQAPDDVIESWCGDEKINLKDFCDGVQFLHQHYGGDKELKELLKGSQ